MSFRDKLQKLKEKNAESLAKRKAKIEALKQERQHVTEKEITTQNEPGAIKGISKKEKGAGMVIGTAVGIGLFVPLGILVVIIGIFLTLTVIGAIIGIPMIIAGIAMIVVGPFGGFLAMGTKRAKCPYCNNELTVKSEPAMTCKFCQKRLLNQSGKLILVQ